MKPIEKIAICVFGLYALGFGSFGAWYLYLDLRFSFLGKNSTANITSVRREFAGYSESMKRGTRPSYRYRFTYSFETDQGWQYGEATTKSALESQAKSLPLQYMEQNPSQHRVLTSELKIYRLYPYVGLFLLVGAAIAFIVVRRRRSRNLHASG